MATHLFRKFFLIFFGGLFLVGLSAPLLHYLAPRPTAELLETQNIPPGPEWFLQQMPLYDQHFLLTFFHLAPSFLFIAMSLIQLLPSVRRNYPQVHRLNGRLFLGLGTLVGFSGIGLALVMPFGSSLETYGTPLMVAFFLYALWRGYRHAVEKQFDLHKLWMLRMLAVGYAPLTMRPLFNILLVTTDLPAKEIFAELNLLAVIINLVLVEIWLRFDRNRIKAET